LSRFPSYIGNSVILAVGTTFFNVLLGTLGAYAITRLNLRRERPLMLGLLATRMVPPITLLVPIFIVWRQVGLLGTYQGMIIAFMSFGLPITIWMMRSYLVDIPIELEEAAMVDGCSRIGAFWRITLPLVTPGLTATAILIFIGTWNEFLFAAVLGSNETKTITVDILSYITDNAILFGRLFAAAGLILLPIIIFTILVQRYIATGLTGGAVKG
jgi:ABC-type glycerol-3-phosphate transport system permease component